MTGMIRAALVAVFAVGVSFVADVQAQEPQGPSTVTSQERAILLEFFEATGGPRWTQTGGWGASSDPCEWQGVICLPYSENGSQRWAPAWLELSDNNLTGTVPRSILQLPHLKRLYLPGNRITSVPEELFTRANDNQLDLWLAGNPIPDMLVRVKIQIEVRTGMCVADQMDQFSAELDGATLRGRYQAYFCLDKAEKSSYCLEAEPFAGGFELVSRALHRLGWKRENQRHRSPVPMDHDELFKATLTWGDGTLQEIETHDGHAPLDTQIASQLIRSLIHPQWTMKARRTNCQPR
jgi:Leucine Rich Repeat (LRR) protein